MCCAALVFCAVGCCGQDPGAGPGVVVEAKEIFRHQGSSLHFPTLAEGWTRHEVALHSGDELRVLYRKEDAEVTVRIHPRFAHQEGGEAQTLKERFVIARGSFFWSREGLGEPEVVMLREGAVLREGLISALAPKPGATKPVSLRLALFARDSWFVQYRVTSQGLLSKAQKEDLVGLMHALHVPPPTPR